MIGNDAPAAGQHHRAENDRHRCGATAREHSAPLTIFPPPPASPAWRSITLMSREVVAKKQHVLRVR